ncbi:hypothetical protein EMIT0P44_190040 [Pseudomonas sp. IT-P44]
MPAMAPCGESDKPCRLHRQQAGSYNVRNPCRSRLAGDGPTAVNQTNRVACIASKLAPTTYAIPVGAGLPAMAPPR